MKWGKGNMGKHSFVLVGEEGVDLWLFGLILCPSRRKLARSKGFPLGV